MKTIQIQWTSASFFVPIIFFVFILSYKTGLKEAFPVIIFSCLLFLFIGTIFYNQKREFENKNLEIKVIKHPGTNKNSEKKCILVLWALLVSILIIPLILLFYGTKVTGIELNNEKLKVSGLYSLDLNYSDIRQIDTVTKIPRMLKSNGFILLDRCFGEFTLAEVGKADLFINCTQHPVIHIITKNGKHIYLNFDKEEMTKSTYFQLVHKIKFFK